MEVAPLMLDYEPRNDYERGALDYHGVYYRWLNEERAEGINPIYLDAMESVMRPFLEAYRKGEVRYVAPGEIYEHQTKPPKPEPEFKECPECAAKPGTPILCPGCLVARANAEQRFITPAEADAGFARAMGMESVEQTPPKQPRVIAAKRWREQRVQELADAIRCHVQDDVIPMDWVLAWNLELVEHLEWLASGAIPEVDKPRDEGPEDGREIQRLKEEHDSVVDKYVRSEEEVARLRGVGRGMVQQIADLKIELKRWEKWGRGICRVVKSLRAPAPNLAMLCTRIPLDDKEA